MYESEDDFFPELYNSNGGAISSVTYNSKRHELPDVVSVCSIRNPCHHHGHCWNDRSSLHGYRCVCHPEYTGEKLLIFIVHIFLMHAAALLICYS